MTSLTSLKMIYPKYHFKNITSNFQERLSNMIITSKLYELATGEYNNHLLNILAKRAKNYLTYLAYYKY